MITIIDEIPVEKFESYRSGVMADLGQKIKIDGFGPGHVPEAVLRERAGEEKILESMAEAAIKSYYPKMLAEQKIDAIGQPKINITKLAGGNALEFKIETAVYPKFDLPKYQEVLKPLNAKPEEPEPVVEKEVDDLLKRATDDPTRKPDQPLPTREQAEEYLKHVKLKAAKDKHRLKLLDLLIKDIEVTLPVVLVEAELDKMLAETKGGATDEQFNKYLEQIKKTVGGLRSEWKENATKRVRAGLILEKIAREEKLEPEAGVVDRETETFLKQYPEVDPTRAKNYIHSIVMNELVWKFLEGVK